MFKSLSLLITSIIMFLLSAERPTILKRDESVKYFVKCAFWPGWLRNKGPLPVLAAVFAILIVFALFFLAAWNVVSRLFVIVTANPNSTLQILGVVVIGFLFVWYWKRTSNQKPIMSSLAEPVQLVREFVGGKIKRFCPVAEIVE